MRRVYNFSPGPAMLPQEAIETIQKELLDWNHTGMSVMEISHRSPEFETLAHEVRALIRELLQVPEEYTVLLMPGGAQMQYSGIPLNLLDEKQTAHYVITGIWSQLAFDTAKMFSPVQPFAALDKNKTVNIQSVCSWNLSPATYVHYVDNETVNGVEFQEIPTLPSQQLVCDMTSNLFTRPVDISRFALVYAGSQKNIGCAGTAIVIVRTDLLGRARALTPPLLHFQQQAQNNCMLNTPPTFTWYTMAVVLRWIKKQGGVTMMAAQAAARATLLYDYLDACPFYSCRIDPAVRSRINAVFYLPTESLTEQFLKEAEAKGLTNLKGHRKVGGIRASMYVGMPVDGVRALVDFMKDFENRHR